MIHARHDPSLSATLVARRLLVYSEPAAPGLDRPPHVRAGSGVVRFGTRLAIVQDDTSFIAIVDGPIVRAVPVPAGPGGRRQFSDALGNKHDKLDLEACVRRGDSLIAFGSGSAAIRERVVIVNGVSGAAPTVRILDAHALYQAMRDEPAFSGSELNVEGAVVRGDTLVFFQRGNGAPKDGRVPVDATCEMPFEEVWDYLMNGGAVPPIRSVVQHDLGAIDGVRLTFTDATCAPSGAIVFLAAAEDSPDSIDDGPVAGVVMGITDLVSTRLAPILEADGAPFRAKAEGICLRDGDPSRADVVIDRDDPDLPCELLEIELRGFF